MLLVEEVLLVDVVLVATLFGGVLLLVEQVVGHALLSEMSVVKRTTKDESVFENIWKE